MIAMLVSEFTQFDGLSLPLDLNAGLFPVLLGSATTRFTTDLYPILSMAKISPCFADILVPSMVCTLVVSFPERFIIDVAWLSFIIVALGGIPAIHIPITSHGRTRNPSYVCHFSSSLSLLTHVLKHIFRLNRLARGIVGRDDRPYKLPFLPALHAHLYRAKSHQYH